MNNSKIKLETKLVGDITGDFLIPSYQRGYRWTQDEVERLLEDIYSNGQTNYCLQPIVVRNNGEYYELIDGQQRLTTIYLIYKYMYIKSNGFVQKPKPFSLKYENRQKSADFLDNIELDKMNENIDFWFMGNAYQTIQNWFENKDNITTTITNVNKYFSENVQIIWYEVGENEDSNSLFTRLNIGKIPLTSAELVKAMFLSRNNSNMDREKQEEISLQWDNIEKELNNDSLWYYLTNDKSNNYQTKIDLVLDLISKKPSNSKDKYYTFFYFDNQKKEHNLNDIWNNIQHTFLILKDWYENHELYHKIGFLIATNTKSLLDLFEMSKDKTKTAFKTELELCIKNSIKISENYSELSYENSSEKKKLMKLLILFNVESVRQNGEHTQWFPFDKFKSGNNSNWSLEHIHAQNSKGLQKLEQWQEWIKLHIPSVECVSPNSKELINRMKKLSISNSLDGDTFENIQQKVINILSTKGSVEFMHSISNLALLNSNDNAALSNSTFDVKRNMIIEMDKKGQFIPFCTKMVFLKYYTPSNENQLHFWGTPDRKAYIEAINTVLENYLEEKIFIAKEMN